LDLYSHRAACHSMAGDHEAALKDANKCIKLDKAFAQGYSRKAAALLGLGKRVEALQTYRQGLLAAPSSVMLQESLAALESEIHGKAPEPPKKTFQTMCRECFQEGHIARDCPKRARSGVPLGPRSSKCTNCGDPGHLTKDCVLPRQVICKGCGQPGHTLRDCRTPSTPIDYSKPPVPQ
jgi:hypothetical protein